MNSSICESTTDIGLLYWKVSTNSSLVVRFVDDRSSRYVDRVDSFAQIQALIRLYWCL